MKKTVSVIRRVFGLALLLAGTDHFVAFLPHRGIEGEAAAFVAALEETGYILPLVHAVNLVAGFCLIGGFFAPLAVLLVAPFMVNIVLFHACLDREGLFVVVPLLLLHAFLLWGYRYHYDELLQAKAQVW
jgi:uncharacterized membrane protein YphA (DoxX/SURF4 family)